MAADTLTGAEHLRILRFARCGRMYRSESGRWLIAGGVRYPERRASGELMAMGLLDGRGRVTPAGREALSRHQQIKESA